MRTHYDVGAEDHYETLHPESALDRALILALAQAAVAAYDTANLRIWEPPLDGLRAAWEIDGPAEDDGRVPVYLIVLRPLTEAEEREIETRGLDAEADLPGYRLEHGAVEYTRIAGYLQAARHVGEAADRGVTVLYDLPGVGRETVASGVAIMSLPAPTARAARG